MGIRPWYKVACSIFIGNSTLQKYVKENAVGGRHIHTPNECIDSSTNIPIDTSALMLLEELIDQAKMPTTEKSSIGR